MVELRDVRRAETRKRRVLEQLGADQREFAKHIRIGKALELMTLVIADESFAALMQTHGLHSIPKLLSQERVPRSEAVDRSLDFVVAWRFFAPFLYDQVTAALLDSRWPGFSLELRDIFISIVADGPFPHEFRGRDRRMIGEQARD
jgi:hypothetical protein